MKFPLVDAAGGVGSDGLTHYEVLGVGENATQVDIAKAFRSLALSLHPDRQAQGAFQNGGRRGIADFPRVVEAYELLTDAVRRGVYDARLATERGCMHGSRPMPSAVSNTGVPMGLFTSGVLGSGRPPTPLDSSQLGGSVLGRPPGTGSSHMTRQRWDEQFVQRHGRFERRPSSRQHGQYFEGSVDVPSGRTSRKGTRPCTPLEAVHVLSGNAPTTDVGLLPPRAPSTLGPARCSSLSGRSQTLPPIGECDGAAGLFSLASLRHPQGDVPTPTVEPAVAPVSQQNGFVDKPPTPQAHSRRRQFELHRARASANALNSLLSHHTEGVAEISEFPSRRREAEACSISVGGRVASLISALSLRKGRSPREPTPLCSSGEASGPIPSPVRLQPSPLDLFPRGIPESHFSSSTSYAPQSRVTPFLRLDQHSSPNRRAASSSLKFRHLRTAGLTRPMSPEQGQGSSIEGERHSEGMAAKGAARRTMLVFFPEQVVKK